ncbi:HesA/MoeB/ThiF family protein [Kitasatospora sp. NPDC101801]|uniref:HesA/MoeB/ThiF family protein n=1 Tax=Kitasatospora sp. NPDC101801 TaxID=3364103 RepID=UPI0037F49DE8
MGSVHYGLGYEVEDPTDLVWQVSQRLDGSRTSEQLVDEVVRECQARCVDVTQVLDFLLGSGSVEDADADIPANLGEREAGRYSRNTNWFSWVDQTPRQSPLDLQSRLKASSVTVIGVGGVGSAAVASLAAMGVGAIHCVDGDTVELSNLNRQILFAEADIGRPKVEVAVERLRRINSDIEIRGTDLMVTDAKALAEIVGGSDLFLHCADRPKGLEFTSNEVAARLGIPWIMGCYNGPMLCVSTFVPGRTVCFACLSESEKHRLEKIGRSGIQRERVDGFNPVIAPTAQMVGNTVALEAIYLLLGMPVQTAGRTLHRNFLDYEHQYYMDGASQPGCPYCGPDR